jgi:hypothetical protein
MRLRETVRIAAVGVIILAKSKSCRMLGVSSRRLPGQQMRELSSVTGRWVLVGKWGPGSLTKFMQGDPLQPH